VQLGDVDDGGGTGNGYVGDAMTIEKTATTGFGTTNCIGLDHGGRIGGAGSVVLCGDGHVGDGGGGGTAPHEYMEDDIFSTLTDSVSQNGASEVAETVPKASTVESGFCAPSDVNRDRSVDVDPSANSCPRSAPETQDGGGDSGRTGRRESDDDAEVSGNTDSGRESDVEADLESGRGLELHKFGDYATYFHNKHMKQQRADESYVQWELQRSQSNRKPIFENCIIYVNGHTVPSINEIHRLVILHGGKFLSYLSKKSGATHIVCDRLTPRKNIEFRNFKVVKASWITDSIAQNTLLPWSDYRTISDIAYGQKRLEFSGKQAASPENNLTKKVSAETTSKDDAEIQEEIENQSVEKAVNEGDTGEIRLDLSDEEIDTTQPRDVEPLSQRDDALADEFKSNSKESMDANHPDFLKHFFAKSRLHHLSNWKADLKLRALKRVLSANKGHSLKAKSGTPDEKLILHIDFDCFFVAASSLNHPNLDIKKDPIVVTHGGKTSDIASCNYVTRKFGVKNGMWMRQAEKLCPNIVKIDYDFDAYEKYSNEFYNYLLSRDDFDVVFPVLIDEVLIDASSLFNEAENKVEFVEDLCSRIRRDIFTLTRCTISIGASRNVLLAKLAIRKAKPDGQYYLYNDIDKFLGKTPIKNLPGIGRSIEGKLLEIIDCPNNVALVENLRPLSKSRLMTVFGEKTGLKLYNYCRGIDDSSIEIDINDPSSVLGRKSVSVDVNFGIRFTTMDQLDNFMMRIAKELYSRLVKMGLCGSSISLRVAKRAPNAPVNPPKHLGMGICDFFSKTSRLGIPTNDWGIIGSEIKSMYRMLNVPVKELRGVAITMTRLKDVDSEPKSKQMKLLFDKGGKSDLKKQFESIERNSAKRSEFCNETITSSKADSKVESKAISKTNQELSRLELEAAKIDWSVFELLPESIKLEIKNELSRRGIISRSSVSPTKTSRKKATFQYFLPSQPGSLPTVGRVVGSPKKKTKNKRTTPFRSPLPVVLPTKKRKTEEVYDHSESYNLSIVNELPSSIRNEVLREVEYKDKIKHYDLETFKDKLAKKELEKLARVKEITSEWVSNQPKYNKLPAFLDQATDFEHMKKLLDHWVLSSLEQMGPHEDDVEVFAKYLEELRTCGQETRGVLLVNEIKKCLLYHQAVNSTNKLNPKFVQDGINSWQFFVSKKFENTNKIGRAS